MTSEIISALRDTARLFYDRNWSVGTSSNYSVVVGRSPLKVLLTASGKDKRALGEGDFVYVDEHGQLCEPSTEKPSAETGLHTMLYREASVGSVLHTHSVWGTLLSDRFAEQGGVPIEGYEMLKGLSGITTHETRKLVPIFTNSQDIAALAKEVSAWRGPDGQPIRHGFLIRNHGLYAWGKDLAEARRHIEIFEFLFEVVGRKLSMR